MKAFRALTHIALIAAALTLPTLARADSSADAWRFEVTPYLFGAALSGTTGMGAVRADLDLSFGDILENFDSGFMAMFEARKGAWGFGFDGVYFRLKDQKTSSWQGPGGIGSATGQLEVTTSEQIYQLSVSYRLVNAPAKFDLIGAARYTRLDTDLNLTATTGPLLPGGTRSLGGKESWWDPVIGFRVIAPLADRWSFVGYADVGGFGAGSDLTWQAIAGVNWRWTDALTLKTGYRYFYQDFEEDGFVWDMAAHGIYAGLGIAF